MIRSALFAATFIAGILASHYIRPALACYEQDGLSQGLRDMATQAVRAPTLCVTSGSTTICQ